MFIFNLWWPLLWHFFCCRRVTQCLHIVFRVVTKNATLFTLVFFYMVGVPRSICSFTSQRPCNAKINKSTKMFTKWVAVARKSLLTNAFCIIFRDTAEGCVFGQKLKKYKIKKLQKHKNVHEMGRRGSKIAFNHCILRHFSRRVSWWCPFRSKQLFLTTYENMIFSIFGVENHV